MERKHCYISNKKAMRMIDERDTDLYPTANDFVTAAVLYFSNKPLTEKRFKELMKIEETESSEMEKSSPFRFSV